MATTGRFYPKGFTSLEQAAIRIAKAREPQSWAEDSFLPGEKAVWARFGVDLNGEAADYCLNTELAIGVPWPAHAAPIYDRLQSFYLARIELRRALFEGQLIGEFVDENGDFDYFRESGWGGVAGEEAVMRGFVLVADFPRSRPAVVLLNECRLEEYITDPDISSPAPIRRFERAVRELAARAQVQMAGKPETATLCAEALPEGDAGQESGDGVPPPLPARGAPKGPRIDDKPIFLKMAPLVAAGQSVSAAAGGFLSEAAGGGSDETKLKRLRTGYSAWAKGRQSITQ